MAKLYFRYGAMGSAKTLNLLAVAHNYRQQGKKVLLIDLDPQANASTGLSELINPVKKNVYDVILSGKANESISSTSIKDYML